MQLFVTILIRYDKWPKGTETPQTVPEFPAAAPMQLTLPFRARGVILGLVFGSFAILANMISFTMIGKINGTSARKRADLVFLVGY